MPMRPLAPPSEAFPYYSSSKGRATREAVYAKTGGYCWYCGTKFPTAYGQLLMEIDHIIERASGGTDSLDNLVPCCSECNLIKGDRGVRYLRYRRALDAMRDAYERGSDFEDFHTFYFETLTMEVRDA